MRIAGIAGIALIATAILLSPSRYPIDQYRYQAEYACLQQAPCASLIGLVGAP